MKRILACAALLAATASFAAQPQKNDTTVVVFPKKVTVVVGDTIHSVDIVGKEGNEKYHFSNKVIMGDSSYVVVGNERNTDKYARMHREWRKGKCGSAWRFNSHIGAGFCATPSHPRAMEVSTFSSWEIFWEICELEFRPWKNLHAFSVGFGLDWRNYRMTNRARFDKDAEGMNVITTYPESTDPKFSRIKVFSLMIPINYHFAFSDDWGLAVGPVVNVNAHSSMKTRYERGDEECLVYKNGIHPVPVTVDFMARLKTPALDVYVKYSPCNVLKSDRGLTFKSLSFGLML